MRRICDGERWKKRKGRNMIKHHGTEKKYRMRSGNRNCGE